MARIILDIKNMPKKDDVLIFNGTEFECKNKSILTQDFVKEMEKQLNNFSKEIADMKSKLELAISEINEKLKSYHNILQVITKE